MSIIDRKRTIFNCNVCSTKYIKISWVYTCSNKFTINNKDDNARLKDALANFGIPPKGVQLGGKRKRKTRKYKRPRKSKKSKRKTNRKKI